MSDATPDTPDPRLVATIREFIVEEVGFDGGEAMTDQAERLAARIEGSLRSQASGGPADLVAEALRGYRLDLGPNTVESIRRGMTRLDLSGGERRDIGLIAVKALGLEAGR